MNAPRTDSQQGLRKQTLALVLATVATGCNAFTAPAVTSTKHAIASSPPAISMIPRANADDIADDQSTRRSVLSSLLTTAVAATVGASSVVYGPSEAFAEAETLERGGVKLTPFNSLAFNYRGGESPTVDATSIDEVSISYAEFLDKLNSDQVTFVEFLAPNGDAAYATLKSSGTEGDGSDTKSTNKPVRIGEGYPIEDPEGWSSPAFVIKAVAKKGVPYKFVVPGLGDSFKL